MDISSIMFPLLNTQISGENADVSAAKDLTPEEMTALFALSRRQDLSHIVGHALSNLGLLGSDETSKKFKQQALQAFYRYARMDHAYGQICGILEDRKIPFIPLKGAVLRSYYPEPWMRTSCDIDILVKEEELEKAVAVLQEQLQYTVGERGDHDLSLNSPSGVHLELHYDTIQERYAVNNCRDVLAQIWEDAVPKTPGAYHHCMSDAMFYFYHIAHMAKHFQHGGCGIRPFLDIWIMNHRMDFNREKRHALLQEGGLLSFAKAAEQLAEVWFSGAQPDDLSQQISEYILRAGLYGDNVNRAALGQAQMGGKLRYLLLRRVFMPYDFLKAEYPLLKKHKWLMPVYQIVRWIHMLRSGRLRQTVREIKANMKTQSNTTESTAEMLSRLGL